MNDVLPSEGTGADYDAIVVGAGFAGLYALHRLRSAGFSVRVFEAAPEVGGTWFWNRYPGARCDVESIDYSYSFDEDLQQEWRWKQRHSTQAEILEYINHVADRFDLRRDIRLSTRVESMRFDEASGTWTVVTDAGTATARYCVMASGVLSRMKTPDIPGIDTFEGRLIHTARWPDGGVDLTGKRVGVIGTGSTGVQAIPVIAKQCAQLYVFQRTPNFSVPARNRPLDDEYVAQVKASYGERREAARRSTAGVPGDPPERHALDFDESDRTKIFEEGWAKGGGPAILRAFSDLLTNEEANATAADFVRSKIHEIVDDPVVAAALTPHDHPLGAKRICVDTDYFATYNRDNVALVDLRSTPIVEMVPTGIRTADRVYDLDIVILAIGFDALTGALMDIDITGRDGVTLQETWASGPRTYLGLTVAGFPNLFAVAGPGSPSVLGNVVHHIEQHVDWIGRCLEDLRARSHDRIEALPEAEARWGEHCRQVAQGTLFEKADSWFVGANVPGKPRVLLPYVGGAARYREACDAVADHDYEGFALGDPAERAPATPTSIPSARLGLQQGYPRMQPQTPRYDPPMPTAAPADASLPPTATDETSARRTAT
jgi:cation diffusion facilitator CzcD-associated flavoprotein CzcO